MTSAGQTPAFLKFTDRRVPDLGPLSVVSQQRTAICQTCGIHDEGVHDIHQAFEDDRFGLSEVRSAASHIIPGVIAVAAVAACPHDRVPDVQCIASKATGNSRGCPAATDNHGDWNCQDIGCV